MNILPVQKQIDITTVVNFTMTDDKEHRIEKRKKKVEVTNNHATAHIMKNKV